jgi:phage gpG-like protein
MTKVNKNQMPIEFKGKTPAQLAQSLKNLIRNAPRAIGIISVNTFKENFELHGWQQDIGNVILWKERNPDNDPGRAILVKSSELRDSIRVVRTTSKYVVVGTRIPYAKLHNEGFIGGVGVRGFHRTRKGQREQVRPFNRRVKMPKRQFIGYSLTLKKRIDKWFINEIKKAFKQ